MICRIVAQRIGICKQMPADAVGIDQLNDGGFFSDIGINGRTRTEAPGSNLPVGLPPDRHVRNFEIVENTLEKSVFAYQELLQRRQEGARFSALNNAVIVSAGNSQYLAQPEQSFRLFARCRELRRIIDGSRRDNCTLPR